VISPALSCRCRKPPTRKRVNPCRTPRARAHVTEPRDERQCSRQSDGHQLVSRLGVLIEEEFDRFGLSEPHFSRLARADSYLSGAAYKAAWRKRHPETLEAPWERNDVERQSGILRAGLPLGTKAADRNVQRDAGQ